MAENNSGYTVGKTYPLDVDALKPNPDQGRKYFDEESIKVLAETIKEDGLLQSISFTTHNDELIIVGGERRWRAIKLLKEQGVTIELTGKYVEGSLRKLAFVENLFREDMTAVEFAESVHALENEDKELTQGAIGQLLGLKRTTVNGILSIAKMPEQIRDKVRNNPYVSRDKLEKISRIKGKERQEKAVDALLNELEKKKTDDLAANSPLKGQTRGRVVANSLKKFTEKLKRFGDTKYAIRLSPEDRELIASQLTTMHNKIQETLNAMSQGKADWDKIYTENRPEAKPRKKKAPQVKDATNNENKGDKRVLVKHPPSQR